MPGPINATAMRNLWKQIPDRQTVTFQRRLTATPTYTSYSIPNAWFRPEITGEGAPSQGVYLKRFRKWFLVHSQAIDAGFKESPEAGDLIANSVTPIDPIVRTWTVLNQTKAGALGAWELESVYLEIRSAFGVNVAVQRRTGDQDATARILPTTSTVTTVKGWFQPDDPDAEPELLGKTQMPAKGTIYFASFVPGLLATDTLFVNSTSYNILTVRNPLGLEELQYSEVELAR